MATVAEELKNTADEAAGFKTVQKPRHTAKAALNRALSALQGRVGINPDQQIALLKEALNETFAAQHAIHDALELAVERDFEAHQKAKAATRAVYVEDTYVDDDGDVIVVMSNGERRRAQF